VGAEAPECTALGGSRSGASRPSTDPPSPEDPGYPAGMTAMTERDPCRVIVCPSSRREGGQRGEESLSREPSAAFDRAAGRTLAFSADPAFAPPLIDWLAAADLVVHESTNLVHPGVHTALRGARRDAGRGPRQETPDPLPRRFRPRRQRNRAAP